MFIGILTVVCEGWFFERIFTKIKITLKEPLKKLSWSKPQARWQERLFYINDIITSLQKPKNQ
jgi:hypothetical protein